MRHAAQKLWHHVREQASVGRRIVSIAALIGVAFFLRQLLAQDEDLYPAFLKGVGAAFAVMVLLGTVQQFWRDKKLNQAQGPGATGGLTFEDESKARSRPSMM